MQVLITRKAHLLPCGLPDTWLRPSRTRNIRLYAAEVSLGILFRDITIKLTFCLPVGATYLSASRSTFPPSAFQLSTSADEAMPVVTGEAHQSPRPGAFEQFEPLKRRSETSTVYLT